MPAALLAFLIYITSALFVVPIALIDQDGSAQSKELVKNFESYPGILLLGRDSATAERLQNSRVTMATVIIPPGFGQSVERQGTGKILVNYDNTRDLSALTILEIRKPIFSFYAKIAKDRQFQQLGGEGLASVTKLFIDPVLKNGLSPERVFALIGEVLGIEEKGIYTFALPPLSLPGRIPLLMMSVILFFSAIIAPFTVMSEKRVGLLDRILTLPILPHDLMLPKLFVLMGLIFLQSLIVVGMMQYYYAANLFSPWTVVALLTTFGYATACLSMFLATISKRVLGAMELVIAALALQIIFGTFAVNPSTLPATAQTIYYSVPSVQAHLGMSIVILTHLTAPATGSILYMLGFGTFFAVLSMILFRYVRPK